MITYGQRHKPRAYQRQRHIPRTCQSMVHTHVDGLARITGLSGSYSTAHPRPPNGIPPYWFWTGGGVIPFFFLVLNPHSSRAKYSRNDHSWRCSNKEARKRLARRHSRNSCHVCISIVVCACRRHALDFKIIFLRSFVTRKCYCVTYFT